MEEILGGKITPFNEQALPGLVSSEGADVVYFSEFASGDPATQMHALTGRIDPPMLKHGGVATTSHTLTLPDGRLFHAIRYRGDLEGWRCQIAEGAKALGVIIGQIEKGSTFVLSDGRSYALADCKHGTV